MKYQYTIHPLPTIAPHLVPDYKPATWTADRCYTEFGCYVFESDGEILSIPMQHVWCVIEKEVAPLEARI